MNKQDIVIVGLKNCGKSSVGRLLAKRLQRPCYDADSLLEEYYSAQYQQCLGLREIYGKLGKEDFDKLQISVLQDFFARCKPENPLHIVSPLLLSLGGGAGDLDEIGALLKRENCFVILLEEQPQLLFERIIKGGLPPFLQDTQNEKAAFAKFCTLSELRLQRYHSWAKLIVPCAQRSEKEIGANIAEELQYLLQSL